MSGLRLYSNKSRHDCESDVKCTRYNWVPCPKEAMMPSTAAPVTKPENGNRPAAKFEQALLQLESLCAALQPGDRIPALPELMRRFGVSERAVLRSLDELQRQGRIVRRHGAGTFIAEPVSPAPVSVTNQQAIIAVRTPDNSYFDRCVDLLFPHTEALGLPLICRIVGPGTGAEAAESLVPANAEGQLSFILFRYDLAPLARRIQEKGCRVVIVGAPSVDVTPTVPCVYSDHQEGGYLVTRHLLDLGHRRIAYHASNADYARHHRFQGHQRAITEAKRREGTTAITDSILPDAEMVAWRTDPARVVAFFRRPDAPTSIVAWNDHEAARLVIALSAAGIRVPDDVSVIGYDNLPEGQIVQPPLSTVDHAMDWQIRTALDLLRRPNLPTPSHTMTVLPTLLPRGSTAPPA